MNYNEFNRHTILQRESTMAIKALRKMTGNKKLVMLAAYHSPLFERTGGGRIWGRAMTRTREAVQSGHPLQYLGPCYAPLPSDRSRWDVHAILQPMDIGRLLRRLMLIIMVQKYVIIHNDEY